MQARARSRPPQWLVIVIVVVGTLGILTAAFEYIDGGQRSGRSSGSGPVGAPGSSLSKATVTGTARSVEIAGAVGLPSLALDTGTDRWFVRSSGAPFEGTGLVTAQGPGIVASVFRALIGPAAATFISRDGSIALTDGTLVNGVPVRGNAALVIDPKPYPWLDAPQAMEFRAVGQFSWAGSGEVAVADQHFAGEFLGAMGSLTVTVTRAADAVTIAGSGGVQQVFVDGQPALKTTATIQRLRSDITVHPGDPNQNSYITWAPQDTGSFGLCILRVTPRSGHAEWVNVGLQHMPPMFGGEQHSPAGGDTSGLGDQGRLFSGPDAIDSFIGVGDADRRDLSLSIPADTPPGAYTIEIAIEGNFDPVVFSMTVTVAA